MNGRVFFSKNNGLQNQPVLYWAASLHSEAKVLLDPNTLSPNGTTALTTSQVSNDAQLLAYGVQHAGSDWTEIRVRNIETGVDFPETLKWVKFSNVAWAPDGSGFYYSRYPVPQKGEEPNVNHQLYFHRVGTTQDQDVLIHADAQHKTWRFSPQVTKDGNFLIVSVSSAGTKNKLLIKDLKNPQLPIQTLMGDFDASYVYLGNDGKKFYFETNQNAPNSRIVSLEYSQTHAMTLQTVVPQTEHTISSVALLNNQWVVTYLKDAHSHVVRYDKQGKRIGEVKLPGLGTLSGFNGASDQKEAYFNFSNFNTPATTYKVDLDSGDVDVVWRPTLNFNPEDYETNQVFVTSKDGTQVPMFLIHRKNLPKDGKRPTLLYGYGGFNISLTPNFSPAYVQWMERGGVVAIPNLRGGGEYGDPWHEAGKRHKKQNVFDDFIAAAEWLIQQKYTSPKKLAIHGRSNGGLLVGAVMTQRPELFGAAVPGVGVLDMLRFQKFTIGWAWTDEYGSSDNPEDFKNLYGYSPYHRVKPGTFYPPTLVITADHDDRVVPAHSYKFAAALQAAQGSTKPILLRVDKSAGHGGGMPTAKKIDEWTDLFAFLSKYLGVPPLMPVDASESVQS